MKASPLFFSRGFMSLRIDQNKIPISNDIQIDRESPLWQAAEGMEANFLKEMLKNMRKTVQEGSELANSRGYQVFRGMLDEQYAEKAAQTQGVGLAELIVKQVMEMQEAARQSAPVEVRELNKSDVIGN